MTESPHARAAKEAVPGVIAELEKFKETLGPKFKYSLDSSAGLPIIRTNIPVEGQKETLSIMIAGKDELRFYKGEPIKDQRLNISNLDEVITDITALAIKASMAKKSPLDHAKYRQGQSNAR